MVQNDAQSEPRRRGRPKAYDRDAALTAALGCFWKAGYAGTSMDDLSAAMGMNRPSIYAAFGDKKALYLEAVETYRRRARQSVEATLSAQGPLCERLKTAARNAIAIYVADPAAPKGCFVIGTAVTEAAVDADVRRIVEGMIIELETVFAQAFEEAKALGERLPDVAPLVAGQMIANSIYGAALRARAGIGREALEAMAFGSIERICASPAA